MEKSLTYNLLVLGGTTLAREMIDLAASLPDFRTIVCLTRDTTGYGQADHQRVGLIKSAVELSNLLKTQRIDWLIDATHPFAQQISQTALSASKAVNIPLLTLQSPAWEKSKADIWIEVKSHQQAINHLKRLPVNSHVFLSVGGRNIADYAKLKSIHYTARCIRTMLPAQVSNVHVINQKGPFDLNSERQLFNSEKFDCLVTKNAGTPATYSKIVAAREANIPVVMIHRPQYITGKIFHNAGALMDYVADCETGD